MVMHMPKALLDFMGYSFFFWSNENSEPPHIHVCKGHPTTNATKFWINKKGIELVSNESNIPAHDLKLISKYIMVNRADIIEAWFDYFE